MRALIPIAAATLLLGACETAFVGRGPSGRYDLVEVDGRAPPFLRSPGHHCPVQIEDGHFDVDSLARRFELVVEQTGPCVGGGRREVRETGSYVRGGPGLSLETADGRALAASESGDTIRVTYDGLDLRFRRPASPRR